MIALPGSEEISPAGIAGRLGFHPVDAGDITASRAIGSPAALLWRIGNAHGYRGRVGFRLPAAPAAQ